MSAYNRSILYGFAGPCIIAAIVETLAFLRRDLFVPITWTVVDAANAVSLLPLAVGVLMGHFFPPRMKPSVHPMSYGYVPLGDQFRVGLALALVALASAVMFSLYLPCSAFLAGYVSGALFFLSGDRRKGAA